MIKHIERTEFGFEGKGKFDLFHKEITLMIDPEVSMDYAEKCLAHLNLLNQTMIDKICDASIKYCFEFSDDVGMPVPSLKNKRDILNYIDPKILIIHVPDHEEEIGYHMECNCEWEIEHGLEFTVLDDNLLYLGSFNDERPWDGLRYYQGLSWNHVYHEPDLFDDDLKKKYHQLMK